MIRHLVLLFWEILIQNNLKNASKLIGPEPKIWPSVRVIANGNDISHLFAPSISSLTITDEIALSSDKLNITFPTGQFAIPDKGAEIEVFLGYSPFEKSMGTFIVDTRAGDFVNHIRVTASAAPHSQSPINKKVMQEQKTRHFPKGTTIEQLVKVVAKDHSLEPACQNTIARIKLPHLIQKNESDLHFLTRTLQRYGVSAKPTSKRLVCIKMGNGENISNEKLPPFIILFNKISSGSWSESDQDAAGTISAQYRDLDSAKTITVKAGTGEPTKTIPQMFSSNEMATAAAQTMLESSQRSKTTVSFTMPGDPDMFAGRPIQLVGFAEGIPTKLVSKRVTHNLNTQGYLMTIEAEGLSL